MLCLVLSSMGHTTVTISTNVTFYSTVIANADWLKNTWLKSNLLLACPVSSVDCRMAIVWTRRYIRLADHDVLFRFTKSLGLRNTIQWQTI